MAQAARRKQRGSVFSTIRRKLRVLASGLPAALELNLRMLAAKLAGRKTLAVYCTATQLMHVEAVVRDIVAHDGFDRLRLYFLTLPADIPALRANTRSIAPHSPVRSVLATRFLLFCDFLLSVEQGIPYPWLGCKTRACSFHGQPSKGNVYEHFNHKQLNTLFLYGPLMRSHYLEHKKHHTDWPEADLYDVGQPKSDSMINSRLDKVEARRALGLDTSRPTVLFAPSFEYCSSFATHGESIVRALLALDVNVIVKPHPAFYNTSSFGDVFNSNAPRVDEWRDRIDALGAQRRCVFRQDNSLDSVTALHAADIMLTDYSGIAFDGILLDLPMIYWDCPLLYDEYLPERYGIDGQAAKRDLACNVGRDAGIVVNDTKELADAVNLYCNSSNHMARERELMREQLLFNPGRATQAMTQQIMALLEIVA